jgi:tripartite-type tricarboxylate transporter receptor subunit TctC
MDPRHEGNGETRMKNRTVSHAACAALALALGFALPSAAQTYPSKPIKMVVPFPPGGAVDILGRLIGERMTEQMGQPVVVENRPGANGNIAAEAVGKSPADGYTILIAGNGLATNTALYPGSTVNMLRDFVPVAWVGYAPLIMVMPAAYPAKSMKEVIDAAKASPGKMTYASAGSGSSAHLGAELLKSIAQVDMLHVPYKGGAPAIVDLIGGRVDFMLLDPPQALPHIKSGRLKPMVVGSARRLSLLPEVPTMAEAGYPNIEATVWWGVVAPAKTPPDVVNRLNAEINKALANPGVQQKLADLGVTIEARTPAQFGTYLTRETQRWQDLVKRTGIQAD